MDSVLISGGASGGSGGVGVVSVCGSGECDVFNVSVSINVLYSNIASTKMKKNMIL